MAAFEKRLFQGNRTASILLIFAVTAGTVAGALFIAQALIISQVVDLVFLQSQTITEVAYYLVLALVVLLIRAGLIWLQEIFAQGGAGRVKITWRQRLVTHIFLLNPIAIHNESSGELTHVLVEGIESLDEAITRSLPAKALAVLVPALVFLVVLILDPWTTLVYLFAGPMLLLLLALIGGQTKAIQERRFREMSWMSAFFLDILQGLPTLKIFGRSQEQAANIQEISKAYGRVTMEVLRTAFQTALVMEWSATAATALVALEVSLRLMNGHMPFNIALAVLLLTPEFFLPIRQYALTYHAAAQGKAAAQRIFEIMNKPVIQISPAAIQDFDSEANHETALKNHDDILFDQISFAYQQGERPALIAFSMTIPHGRSLALVGSTGAGKSTVARLLLRFIEPDQGAVYHGGRPLNQVAPHLWRRQVAWVPQQPHLFFGTFAENIRLARTNASKDEVINAAQAANLHEFIKSLPEGYETQIGEQGLRLSGGQRQRLAIARAFLKDSSLLILDEATSHLDPTNEELISDALSRLMHNRTVLIIAHRLPLASLADQIVVMERGRLVQQGSHAELLSEEGQYRQLVHSFAGGPP